MHNIETQNISKFKGWQRVLLFIIPLIIALFIGSTFSYYLVEFIFKIESLSFIATIGKLMDSFFITLFLLIFVKYIDKTTFLSLGFSLKNRIKDIFIGIFLGLFIMLFAYVYLGYSNEIMITEQTINYKEIANAIVLYTLVAYMEEVVFRGYFLNNFMLSCNKFWALFWSSILFALLHGLNPNMDWFSSLSLFLAGYFLGITYIFTKNLWFPIAIHFSWNFFQSMVGFNVSGQDFYSVLNFKILNPNRINGGNFGLEGSYISTIFIVLFIISVVTYYTKIKK